MLPVFMSVAHAAFAPLAAVDDLSSITGLVTFMLSLVTIFFNFAATLIIPQKVAGAYDITLLNVVVWVPLFLIVAKGAAGFIKGLMNRRGSAS